MALKPEISLGVQPPAAIDFLKFGQLRNLAAQNEAINQQIMASRTAQAAQEAQIPGIRAESETAQQVAARARQDQAARDELLRLASTGKFNKKGGGINYSDLHAELATRFPQQALTLAKEQADQEYAAATARTQEATSIKERTAADTALFEFQTKKVQDLAKIISKLNIPEQQKLEMLADKVPRLAETYPDAFKNSPYLVTGPDGVKSLTPNLGRNAVNQIAEGSISPKEATELAQAQQRIDIEAMQASLPYQEQLAVIGSKFTPAAARLPAVGQAVQEGLALTDLSAGLNVSGIVGQALGPTRIGSEVGTLFTKNLQGANSAEFQTYQRAIDTYNARNPNAPISLEKLGVLGVDAKLRAEATRAQGGRAGAQAQATNPNPAGAFAPQPPATGVPPPGAQPLPQGTQIPAPAQVPAAPARPAAPAAAIAALRANPALAPQFQAKYGYLPQ